MTDLVAVLRGDGGGAHGEVECYGGDFFVLMSGEFLPVAVPGEVSRPAHLIDCF